MNCRDFELVVVDIARAETLQAFEQATALAHAAECATCAARLQSEQKLTVYLQQTAEATCAANQQASPLLEARLLHAFRAQASSLPAATTLPNVTTGAFGVRRWSMSSRLSINAIAATLALFALAALLWRLQTSPPPAVHVSQASNLPSSDHQPPTLTIKPIHTVASTAPALEVEAPRAITHPLSAPRSSRRQRTKPIINLRAEVARLKSASGFRAGELAANSIKAEVATEFFPITLGSSLDGIGSGHVVRVQLPHTALASFGLPMNPERADETVKADVVLGDDGLAQAIRFVR